MRVGWYNLAGGRSIHSFYKGDPFCPGIAIFRNVR